MAGPESDSFRLTSALAPARDSRTNSSQAVGFS